ncbi:hypothetical protein JCM10207_009263 [Rhodosporidiobolus poonsookiae]
MSTTKLYTLSTGAKLPAVGLGCWMGAEGENNDASGSVNEETYTMVRRGVEAGYRHFDTASGYGNEEAVGRALRDSVLAREEYFLTTKLGNVDHHRVKEALDRSLKAFGLEYIDLYLMHWPQAIIDGSCVPYGQSPTFSETWTDMEALLSTGKVKSIGVSNFSIKNLEVLLQTAKVVPAVNQCEGHPYLPNHALAAYCASKGIQMTAYSPIGQSASSPVLHDPLTQRLASKYNQPAGSVLLSWGVQRGWAVVPKSSNPARMRANLAVFELEKQDMDALDVLHKEPGKASHTAQYQSLCEYQLTPTSPPDVLRTWNVKEEFGWDYPLFIPKE